MIGVHALFALSALSLFALMTRKPRDRAVSAAG
jgi:hypothetical protein